MLISLLLKLKANSIEFFFKKLGADRSNGATSKAGSSTRGGKTAVPTRPNTANGKATQTKGSTQVQGGVRCYRCGELGHRSNECPKRRTDALVNLVENDDDEGAIWEDEI
ncbi:hypothetical protein LWI29_034649 [Acer saccharum]|uniref:CCHC-type domain-containing protein n=1 Tax=Acer saccharum TaxID=4024 RepID=A0AA39RKP1_ACESA|nr:hypothetical protein LWI29_034649 [Acer saccharum]